jgi:hypothetical protein
MQYPSQRPGGAVGAIVRLDFVGKPDCPPFLLGMMFTYHEYAVSNVFISPFEYLV